jgi:hypothetical protein
MTTEPRPVPHSGVELDRLYSSLGAPGWTGRGRCVDCPERWSVQLPGSPSDEVVEAYWRRRHEAPELERVLGALAGA